MLSQCDINKSIYFRNKKWSNIDSIPSWVNINNVELDQFFTNKDVASNYFHHAISKLKYFNEDLEDVLFIEPSAGSGSFFNLLPIGSIGIDIHPLNSSIIKDDFLSWNPPQNSKKKIVFIGNPPFGYRGWLALSFMNHAAKFADYIAFVLPMSFQSDGKGSPKNRVKGMRLIHSEIISQDSFHEPSGKVRKVNALWQIWKKGVLSDNENKKTCSTWVDLFTVDMRKERLCGQMKIKDADFFLQRTYYNNPPILVRNFADVKYVCGYGLIIKKDKSLVVDALNTVDWFKYSNLATHNCRHISMYHIKNALIDKGFIDV
jgi:hypothetical protein